MPAPRAERGTSNGRVGGSTFTLDVWEGHPHADEAYAVLARFRAEHTALYERIEAHNAEHGRPLEYELAESGGLYRVDAQHPC